MEYRHKDLIPKIRLNESGEVPYFTYPILEETGLVKHGFSTRLGGVSTGVCTSMNLDFKKEESRENVLENFRRMAKALDMPYDRLTASHQTHTTNVRRIYEQDAGNGISKPGQFTDVDGMITNVRNLPLVTFYADCVPLFFLDVKNKAIGLSHSGWRGTVGHMGAVTVKAMSEEFGSNPSDIIACIGPSICDSCYEVSEDVILEFKNRFDKDLWDKLFYENNNGKYQLNLWEANKQVLLSVGILEEHIAVTDVCTCCNPELLFSHRASKGQRGALAAFLALK